MLPFFSFYFLLIITTVASGSLSCQFVCFDSFSLPFGFFFILFFFFWEYQTIPQDYINLLFCFCVFFLQCKFRTSTLLHSGGGGIFELLMEWGTVTNQVLYFFGLWNFWVVFFFYLILLSYRSGILFYNFWGILWVLEWFLMGSWLNSMAL